MPEQKSKTLISFTNGAYKEVPTASWRHSNWIHFTLRDGSKLCVNPANVNYLHILPEVLTEATVAPFERAADCPAHDSRCTNELCILDPRHPGHADQQRLSARRWV